MPVSRNYFGVFPRGNRRFEARVKAVSLGSFESPEEAALAVNRYIERYQLNLPKNVISDAHLKLKRAREKAAIHKAVMRVPRNYAQGPEAKIQADILDMLHARGWFAKHLHGNMYQVGMPDIYACRKPSLQRFIEVKNPARWKFEQSQLICFKELHDQGVGVWIMFGATDAEYKKLFGKPNFPILAGLPLQ